MDVSCHCGLLWEEATFERDESHMHYDWSDEYTFGDHLSKKNEFNNKSHRALIGIYDRIHIKSFMVLL